MINEIFGRKGSALTLRVVFTLSARMITENKYSGAEYFRPLYKSGKIDPLKSVSDILRWPLWDLA